MRTGNERKKAGANETAKRNDVTQKIMIHPDRATGKQKQNKKSGKRTVLFFVPILLSVLLLTGILLSLFLLPEKALSGYSLPAEKKLVGLPEKGNDETGQPGTIDGFFPWTLEPETGEDYSYGLFPGTAVEPEDHPYEEIETIGKTADRLSNWLSIWLSPYEANGYVFNTDEMTIWEAEDRYLILTGIRLLKRSDLENESENEKDKIRLVYDLYTDRILSLLRSADEEQNEKKEADIHDSINAVDPAQKAEELKKEQQAWQAFLMQTEGKESTETGYGSDEEAKPSSSSAPTDNMEQMFENTEEERSLLYLIERTRELELPFGLMLAGFPADESEEKAGASLYTCDWLPLDREVIGILSGPDGRALLAYDCVKDRWQGWTFRP